MGEEEIRRYLARQTAAKKKPNLRVRTAAPPPSQAPEQDTFKNFNASVIFCPKCRQAQPVHESVILYLPDGVLTNYGCTTCGTSLGTRTIAT